MKIQFITLITVIFTLSPTLTNASGKDEPFTDPIPFILWAASDPLEDRNVKPLVMRRFVTFTLENLDNMNRMYEKNDLDGFAYFLGTNAEVSGTNGVQWYEVFAKLDIKKATGQTEDKEYGLPSLVAWIMRNTGPGTSYPQVDRTELVITILEDRTVILDKLTEGQVDSLADYLTSSTGSSKGSTIDWTKVINYLKDERQLYKYSCGTIGLQLCDRN